MDGRASPLRLEVNPWTLDHSLHEALLLREAYIAALGTVETILTELAIRASWLPSYSTARLAFPKRRGDRIGYLRKIAILPGPLLPYASILLSIIDRYEAENQRRDMLAHGRMQVLTMHGGGARIKLRGFSAMGKEIAMREDVFWIDDFRHAVHKRTRMSRAVDRLYDRLDVHLPEFINIEARAAAGLS